MGTVNMCKRIIRAMLKKKNERNQRNSLCKQGARLECRFSLYLLITAHEQNNPLTLTVTFHHS